MKNNEKTIYKLKWKNLITILIVIVLSVIIGFFGIRFLIDSNNTTKIIEKIKNDVKIDNLVDDEYTKTIAPDSKLSKFDIYWDYIKLGLIDVDMESLKKINSDSIGYIEIKGTDFSYPIVENENNFYTTHSFDKNKNSLGWIYIDKETSIESFNSNTIIYANKVWGNKLSGALNEMFKKPWNEDKNNFVIRLSTNYNSSLWQIISIYKTNEKDYLKKDFADENDFQSYSEKIIKKSAVRFKTTTLPTDKLLTITTNSKNSNNIVIQAKLIKIREEP